MNMFRSLANLTAHKRSYCIERYEDVTHVFSNKIEKIQSSNLKTVIVEGETVETVNPEDCPDEENYSPSLDLLKDAGLISEIEEKPLLNKLLPNRKPSLSSVVAKLSARSAAEQLNKLSEEKNEVENDNTRVDAVLVEPISQTVKARFQSYSAGYRYKDLQALESAVSVVLDQEGKEVKGATTNKDDVRTKSPTNSEESKENIEEEFDQNVPVDDNGNTVKYPCPECKKGFSKLGNVYKHLHNVHGRTKDEYTKLRQEIQDNAYVVDKADGMEKPQKAALQNLALAIGLVNKQGVGMQKFNKPTEKPGDRKQDDIALSELQAPRRGRPPKSRNSEPENVIKSDIEMADDDSDTEVSFNPGSLSPDSQGSGGKGKKRKRTESSRVPITNAWRGGQFQCVLCERSFGTPTFLMQHYVSPHFSKELRNEFGAHLGKKKCPQCKSTFDTETKLLMHIGCTHREVHKYLPEQAKDLMPGVRNAVSPTKVAKTPAPTQSPAPVQDMFQKFAKNIVSSGGKTDKKNSPKSVASLIPQLEDEFMS